MRVVGARCPLCPDLFLSTRLSLLSLFSPELAGLNWIRVDPETTPRSARFVFSLRVELAIFRRLLALILFVMPGHAGFDLFEVDVSSIKQDLSHQTTVLIGLLVNDGDVLSKNHFREILL